METVSNNGLDTEVYDLRPTDYTSYYYYYYYYYLEAMPSSIFVHDDDDDVIGLVYSRT